MALAKIETSQINGYSSGGGWQTFSATPGNVTSFTITASATVRSGVIALANTTDSLYIAASFTFGDLATGSSRTCYGKLFNNDAANGQAKYIKVVRDSTGTGLTVSLWAENDRELLATTTGLIAPTSSAVSLFNLKYVADVRTG